MNQTDSLKSAENALRDLLNYLLPKTLGEQWMERCGVSKERLSKWQERQVEDERRFGTSDPRIIYYADFYDLRTILRKCWDKGLSDVFGDLKKYEVLLEILEDYRNPDAHRRELLPYQRDLASGISGDIRSKIAQYYSAMETRDSYYSRLESIHDSLGNSWSIGDRNPFQTKCILRSGDTIQFRVSASDPMGEAIEYLLCPLIAHQTPLRSVDGSFDLILDNSHVRKSLWIRIAVKSPREFHQRQETGLGAVDDLVSMEYEVLPPRNSANKSAQPTPGSVTPRASE